MAALSPSQYAVLAAMGIPVWQVKDNKLVKQELLRSEAVNDTQDIILPLLGNADAALLFIGEKLSLEGATPSSRLFLAMLSALGLSRHDIAVLPWQSEHQAMLLQHLAKAGVTQLIILGQYASQDCFEQQSLDSLRGNKQQLSAIDTWVSYHPDMLLEHPERKAAVWQDLQSVRRA